MDGHDLLANALNETGINITALIAKCAIWANPQVHEQLRQEPDNPHGAWLLKCRRKRGDERVGQIVNGTYVDNNSKAGSAIRSACGVPLPKNRNLFACHLWDNTCYDESLHTVIANLILLPSALASLTDHHEATKAALRYKSYKLYGWCPNPDEPPGKPNGFDALEWRAPEEFTDRIRNSINSRVRHY